MQRTQKLARDFACWNMLIEMGAHVRCTLELCGVDWSEPATTHTFIPRMPMDTMILGIYDPDLDSGERAIQTSPSNATALPARDGGDYWDVCFKGVPLHQVQSSELEAFISIVDEEARAAEAAHQLGVVKGLMDEALGFRGRTTVFTVERRLFFRGLTRAL